jgi:hypothetical protein
VSIADGSRKMAKEGRTPQSTHTCRVRYVSELHVQNHAVGCVNIHLQFLCGLSHARVQYVNMLDEVGMTSS